MNNKNIMTFCFLFYFIVLVTLVSGSLGTFKSGECLQIKTILNSSSATISTITLPNSTMLILDEAMTQNGKTFNYTFCSTDLTGTYVYDYYSAEGNVYVNDFDITLSGKEPSGDITTLGLVLIFILLIGLGIWTFLYVLGTAIQFETSILDVGYSVGLFLGFLGYVYISYYYLGNALIYDIMSLLLFPAGAFLILMPIVSFILSIWKQAQIKDAKSLEWGFNK